MPAMISPKTALGSFIRSRRIALQLSQDELAKRCGLKQSAFSVYERGGFKSLRSDQVIIFASAMKCDPAEIRELLPKRKSPPTELGRLVRARREELGLSLKGLDDLLGFCHGTTCYLENKRHPGLNYALVKPLATALQIDQSKLQKFLGVSSKTTNSLMGQMIRAGRKAKGISITTLADLLGVTRQYVSQVELGDAPLCISDEFLGQLSTTLDLNLEELKKARRIRRMRASRDSSTPLGQFLTNRRLELGLTQVEVGERAGGIAGCTVSNVECGVRNALRSNILKRLAVALECEIPPELLPSTSQETSNASAPSG